MGRDPWGWGAGRGRDAFRCRAGGGQAGRASDRAAVAEPSHPCCAHCWLQLTGRGPPTSQVPSGGED